MDPISDMLTRMRNALKAKKEIVEIPHSRIKREIARILREEGYISNFRVFEDGKAGILKILLRYTKEKEPAIFKIERVSRPSCRVYCNWRGMGGVRQDMATMILSTPKGVVTARQAKDLKIGGEVLLKVW
ncbi:MAG: 30S ribosomal protein S8 [Elusimicrobia bacterium]|nr:30S ribosomal protein S8 [Elusimicrobiota bacterium]